MTDDAPEPFLPTRQSLLSRLKSWDEQDSELWEREWQSHLTAAAVARVKRRVKPEQFQLFDLYVLKGWPVKKVAAALGASSMQVYLARHRVGALFREELQRLASRDA